jgi:hypothetical protein
MSTNLSRGLRREEEEEDSAAGSIWPGVARIFLKKEFESGGR